MNKILKAIQEAVYNVLSADIPDQNIDFEHADIDSEYLNPDFIKAVKDMDKETIIKLHEKYGCKYRVHTKNELKMLIKKFIWCEILYHSLNWIDTSEITDMSHLFDNDDRDSRFFNFDISEWDVSNVTDMSGMFKHCSVFNRPLNKWNVSNVTDMSQMFSGCTRFNQNLDQWKVCSVTDMTEMFLNNRHLNQDFSMWDTSNVTEYKSAFTGTKVKKLNRPNFKR